MYAIPENPELLHLAVLALEESGRPRMAKVLRRWADDLPVGPDPTVDWASPAWIQPEDVETHTAT
jgi:hypothetical protein